VLLFWVTPLQFYEDLFSLASGGQLLRMKNLLMPWPAHTKLGLKASKVQIPSAVIIRRHTDMSVNSLRVLCGPGKYVKQTDSLFWDSCRSFVWLHDYCLQWLNETPEFTPHQAQARFAWLKRTNCFP